MTMGDRDRFFSSDYKETGVITCMWMSEPPDIEDNTRDIMFRDCVPQ